MIIDSIASLVKLLVNVEDKSVVLYGKGKIGTTLCKWIYEADLIDKVECFAVTKLQENENDTNNISVYQFKDNDRFRESKYKYIICVKDKHSSEDIVSTIKANHVVDENIFCLSPQLILGIEDNKIDNSFKYEKITQCMHDILLKTIPLSELKFAVHITNHCNLNCAGCNQFIPLAEKGFMDLDIFQRDISRLAELSDHEAYRIQLLGGEPLINPKAIAYAKFAREQFPYAKITFLSNGVTARNLSSEFYQECRENKIEIDFSPYPIDIDYDDLKNFVEQQGVICHIRDRAVREFVKNPILLNPDEIRSHATSRWLSCSYANDCINLYDGKLSCAIVSTIHWLKKYYPEETQNIRVTPRDYIDIYQIKSINEIFEFFSHPFPFCKYCGREYSSVFEWKKSNCALDEWT